MNEIHPPTHRKAGEFPCSELEGMHVEALLTAADTKRLSVYRIRIPERHRVPQSYHKIAEETIIVLEGKGSARIGKRIFRIQEGDSLWIPAGTHHGFETQESPMKILAVPSPRVDTKTDFYYVQEAAEVSPASSFE